MTIDECTVSWSTDFVQGASGSQTLRLNALTIQGNVEVTVSNVTILVD